MRESVSGSIDPHDLFFSRRSLSCCMQALSQMTAMCLAALWSAKTMIPISLLPTSSDMAYTFIGIFSSNSIIVLLLAGRQGKQKLVEEEITPLAFPLSYHRDNKETVDNKLIYMHLPSNRFRVYLSFILSCFF